MYLPENPKAPVTAIRTLAFHQADESGDNASDIYPRRYALGLLTTHFTYRDYNRSSERIPGWRIYGLLEFEAPPSRLSPRKLKSARVAA